MAGRKPRLDLVLMFRYIASIVLLGHAFPKLRCQSYYVNGKKYCKPIGPGWKKPLVCAMACGFTFPSIPQPTYALF